ncbi:type I-C CRISPR-associated protein Cas8c/Csd1 [Basfia succiniciproducens]|uniref:type I-C CRISPR-associated protein Cas8c/Csd1 n=1 Tax=Basfia succiniciproducens TaxID=653940 RepID=UPI003FCE20B1
MSWMQKLYRTYEFVYKQGLTDEDLALPFHMPKAVHLKVVLNDKAELVRAERFEGKKQVPIQVTEKSLNKAGSTIAPHALHDSLQYIAKTAEKYLTIEYLTEVAKKKAPQKGGKKWQKFLSDSPQEKQQFLNKQKQEYKDCYIAYEKQLSEWEKASTLPEIAVVLKYVQEGKLIDDLIKHSIFTFEGNILFSGNSDDPFGFTIVWAVEIPDDLHADLWSKPNIQRQWIQYQESQSEQQDTKQKDLCYVSGEQDYSTEAYPKIDGNAKLVSANDTDGLTFLGRFLSDKQAVSLGRDVSQKAFNTLKWLIKRQGIRKGEPITVAWAISSKEVPSPLQDTYTYLPERIDDLDFSIAEDMPSMPFECVPSRVDWTNNLGFQAAQIIKKKMHGYLAELKQHEQISLLMLDSATPGRMALIYYQEFLPTDYFANLDAWIDDFAWYQRYSREKQDGKKTVKHTEWPCLPPSPYAIFETIYGKTADKEGKIKKQLYTRLLPVIAGGSAVPIPYDLVVQSFQMACNPSGSEYWEWERNIGVACALYKGWCARHHDLSQRRLYSMALDKENRSRDYLYGRLLAIAENIESYALYLAEEKRATTAERYMQRFAEHPFATWRNIELALKPYQDRLRNRGKDTGTQAIGEIMDLFQNEDFVCDDKLNGEFLLGYHCQKMELTRQIAARAAAKEKKTETAE